MKPEEALKELSYDSTAYGGKCTIQQDKLHGRPNYTLCDTFSLFILKKAGIMADKTCKTCIENDNGLCDRKGILIEEDDTCENHTKNWMDS